MKASNSHEKPLAGTAECILTGRPGEFIALALYGLVPAGHWLRAAKLLESLAHAARGGTAEFNGLANQANQRPPGIFRSILFLPRFHKNAQPTLLPNIGGGMEYELPLRAASQLSMPIIAMSIPLSAGPWAFSVFSQAAQQHDSRAIYEIMITAAPKGSSNLRADYNMAYVWLMSAVAAMGGLLFGWDWVVIGGAKPFFQRYFALTSDAQIGWANSCALIGCLAGRADRGSAKRQGLGASGCSWWPPCCLR